MSDPQMTGIGYNNGNGAVQEQSFRSSSVPPQDYPQQFIAPKNNYQNATPLASLQQGPTPVGPVCNVREMTRTEYVSGGTTQLVISFDFTPLVH
jgi:lipopolysaccharide-induced tumor necrosis factor-alpha factor